MDDQGQNNGTTEKYIRMVRPVEQEEKLDHVQYYWYILALVEWQYQGAIRPNVMHLWCN